MFCFELRLVIRMRLARSEAFSKAFFASLCASRAASTSSSLRSASTRLDRKSTRLNSSHQIISYAVFCLKKKKKHRKTNKHMISQIVFKLNETTAILAETPQSFSDVMIGNEVNHNGKHEANCVISEMYAA